MSDWPDPAGKVARSRGHEPERPRRQRETSTCAQTRSRRPVSPAAGSWRRTPIAALLLLIRSGRPARSCKRVNGAAGAGTAEMTWFPADRPATRCSLRRCIAYAQARLRARGRPAPHSAKPGYGHGTSTGGLCRSPTDRRNRAIRALHVSARHRRRGHRDHEAGLAPTRPVLGAPRSPSVLRA